MPKLTYKHDWKKIKERALSSHQKDYKIGSVREAVQHAIAEGTMSDPYQTYEKMKEQGVTETKLHASLGSDLQSRGGHVLEFDLAGSGFKQFRARQAGLDGKDHYCKDNVKMPFEEIDRKEKWSVNWWNKLPSFLRDFFGLASVEDIQIQNEEIDRLYQPKQKSDAEKDEVRQSKAKTKSEELIENRYGIHSKLDGLKDKKYIYVKDQQTDRGDGTHVYRTRYSMPGSQVSILGIPKWVGARNRGEYSIQKVSEYMQTAAQAYLTKIFEEWDQNQNQVKRDADVAPITISIKGHSRGGVSAAHGAMMIQDWIKKNYPRYEDQVKFNLIQLDPVAGFGSDHGVKSKINLVDEQRQDIRDELRDRNMSLLGKAAETTVVYSLHTDHRYFFSPQSVDGAKRIILTTTNHGVNLDSVDASQKAYGDAKAHREGYMDLSTGEMYRGSGLNELPEGIYIADENNCLVKVPSLEAGRNIISEVLKDTSGQKERHNRIDAVMENWFKAREKEKDKNRENKLQKEAENRKEIRDEKKETRKKVSLLQEAEQEKQKLVGSKKQEGKQALEHKNAANSHEKKPAELHPKK